MDAISAYSSRQIWTSEEIGYMETARHLEKNGLAVKNGEMPAVNVVLSEESLQKAAEHNAKVFAKQLDGTASDGTAVSVKRTAGIYSSTPGLQDGYINTDALEGYIYSADFADSSGNSISVEFTGDITSAVNADGNRSVYFHQNNTTRTYGADGKYVEAQGNHIAEDANAVYISTSGGALSTGNGNNSVFVYGDNASIQGGAGNDDIRLATGVSNVKIDTGAGDDTISGSTVYGLDLALNDGNNSVSLNNMTGGSVTAEDGNNTLNITKASAASIQLGDGANTYQGYSMGSGASLTMGNGANTLDIYTVGMSATWTYEASSASVSMGNGNNSAKIYEIQSGSQTSMGNGNNTLELYEVESGSSLSVGNGDNAINMYRVVEESTVNVGNGNNKLKLYEIESGSQVTLGDGANRAKIYEVENNSHLTFGSGNNALQMYSLRDSLLNMGDGDNDIRIFEMTGTAKLQTGNGNNIIQVENMKDASQLLVGEGENAFYISNYSSGTSILDSLGIAFDEVAIDSLVEQGLWNSLDSLEKARAEREKQGEATLADFEKDAFFSETSSFNAGTRAELPDKAQVEALRSYAQASLTTSVKLTRDMVPENISRHMSDPGLVEHMNSLLQAIHKAE